ncbi:MAG TPA: efflux RND transporter permease subunit [Vicinamibacteria bacterium]|nr:efflux RND transporter permease subunit [Vicinamibacteria bacterium]
MTPRLPRDQLSFRDLSFGAIRRWRLVLVGALALFLLGLAAWLLIPRLEEPRIEVTAMTVSIPYPGASPEDVETQVVKPIEALLYELPGVEFVEAYAYPQSAFFLVRCEDGVDMNVTAERARGKILSRKRELPAEVKDPEVVPWSTSLMPQMVVAVVGNLSDSRLTAAAKRLKSAVAAVAGVAGVDLLGEHEPAVRVRLDAVRLARHRLSAEQVVRQLQLSNVRIPGGEYDLGPLTTLLEVNQEFTDAEDVGRVPVGVQADTGGGTTTVVLREVAEVRDLTRTPRKRFLYAGQPAVGLQVRFRKDRDAVAVGSAVRDAVLRVAATLPPGMRAVVCHDQPAWIGRSVRSFVQSLLEGMVLVVLVITLGMGWRAALVVSGVIPLAVGGAVLGLFVFGMSLETVSIGGLIVALGLLVDDAVVVTESIQIMRDKGLSPLRAAVFGTARVFWANNGTTAVAIASFLPLFAMGGDIGAYIKGMPASVVLALATSLLVAQLFTPWVSMFVLRSPASVTPVADEALYDRKQDRAEGPHGERNPALLVLRRLYERLIPWVVAHPARVALAGTGLLAASLGLFEVIGLQFFPKADKPSLFVALELPKGSRLESTSLKLAEACRRIQEDPSVLDTSAVLGGPYPEVFSSRVSHAEGSHVADVLVRLHDGDDPVQAASRLRRRLADLVGVNVNVEDLVYGPPVRHPVVLRIHGDDYLELRRLAEQAKERLQAIPGTVNVLDSLSESVPLTRVTLDVDRALRTGLTPARVGQTLRMLHGDDKVTEFRRGEDLVQVVLEPAPEPERPVAALGEVRVPAPGGELVPLKDSARIRLDYGFARLNRRNTQRVVEVTADVDASTLSSSVIAQLEPALERLDWKPGYGYTWAGEREEILKSFRNLGIAAAGAVLLIFLLLVAMFDDFAVTVAVMLAVPYALVGALPGLALTGNPFGFMAFLGLIALIGVYVNHKIYFVDRMLELMRRGEPLETAILQAGQDRLRPVVLTALTAVLGLVPLTLFGGRMWGSFGWVNIFGLIASIPLSLVLLPSFIVLAHRLTSRRRAGGAPS